MMVRASWESVDSKLWLKPRTPESAPTPAATPNTTNRNLTSEDRVSRQAMRAAVRKGSFIWRLRIESQPVRELRPRRFFRRRA